MKTFILFFLQLCALSVFTQNTCITAIPIEYNNAVVTLSGSTTGVPNDNSTSGAGSCVTSVGVSGQKWYSFTWTGCESHNVVLSTDNPGTNFDTKIHVYKGSCGALQCVTGDDDSGNVIGNASILNFLAQPSVTYYIRIGGFNALSGNYVLTLNAGEGGCTDNAACNYSASADWSDCSCCYGECITLSLPQNGFSGPNSYIRLNMAEFYSEKVYPGESITICHEYTCDALLQVIDWESNGWGGLQYTITVNGQSVSNTVPDDVPSQYTHIPTPWCGCTDTNACNFDAAATMDDESCLYREHGTCAEALFITAPSFHQVHTLCEPNEPSNLSCVSEQVKDLWFEFEYTGGMVTLEGTMLEEGEEMVMAIREGCSGNVIKCDNNYNDSYRWYTILSCVDGLVKGETYHIQFGTYSNPGMKLYLEYRVLPIPGCTDPDALNFNECSNMDDGTCQYENAVNNCPADVDGDGIVTVNDLLIVLGAYSTTCQD